MKIFVVLCVVAAVAQAVDVDWSTVYPMDVIPEGLSGIIDEASMYNTEVNSRIVGGDEAVPGQFPYQVALFATTDAGTGFCGGSILNEEWIITAAHCVDGDGVTGRVIAGAHNVVTGDDTQQSVEVAEIIIHPQWDTLTIKNDIALLKLAEKLTLNDNVQPIRLARRSQSSAFVGATGTVSGWGRDSDSATAISPVLRWTSNPIITNARCTIYYFGQIISNQICLSASQGRSSCNGDSGGPLVVVDSDGEVTQVGVVSHGILLGCASGWPGVYTRVTSFLDWIEENTNGAIVAQD